MIWVAEGDTNRVYLLGSIHFLREQDYPLPAAIDIVYRDVEQLVMELDMDDIDPVAALMNLQAYGVFTDGTTLAEAMGPELYGQAEAAAAEADIPIDMFERSEPWLAAMTVQEILMMRIGFQADMGIEMHLMGRAASDGKPISGFETVEQQFQFLDGLSMETQIQWFLQSIIETQRFELLVDELVAAWRSGDVDYLEEELLQEMKAYPEMHDEILVNRNRNWIPPIMAMLEDDDDYLIIVGAAHLVGDNGVPDLLSKQGVRIRLLNEPVR